MNSSRKSSLVFPHRNPHAILRLFCFHYAGGGASMFRNWWKYIPPQVEVVAVQLPGREGRFNEACITNFHLLISALVDDSAVYLDKPYAVFGHSLGGVISFEWIRELGRRGLRQPRLYMPAGSQAPQFPDIDGPDHHLSDTEFTEELLRRYQKTLGEALKNKELREIMLPILRADFRLREHYVYEEGPLLNSPILAFSGTKKSDVSDFHLCGWGAHTTAGFDIHRFSDDHFFILTSQRQLLYEIGRRLSIIIDDLKSNNTMVS